MSLVVREYLRHAEDMSVEISSELQNILKNCQRIIYTFQLKSILTTRPFSVTDIKYGVN